MSNKEETYFLIKGNCDGGCSCIKLTKEEIIKRITPDKNGDIYYGNRECLAELPEEIDNFTDIVIIKGQIVVPKEKKVVTEYEIE